MRALSTVFATAALALMMIGGAAAVPSTRCVCLTFGSIYYDIRVSPSGTTLQRWSNGNLLDSNWYAQLTQPPPGSMWGDGVAYAATMQTRHVWVNTELNSPASWEVVSGEDIWRFDTTISGSPTQLVFRSSNCITMTPPSPSPAPPTPNPNALRRVCGTVGDTYYDMWTSPAGTIMLRFSQGRWLPTQNFAALHEPAPGQMWNEGVVFAAVMQTRLSWFNTEPNTLAWWDSAPGEDRWRFETVMNGAPTTVKFRTAWCTGDATPVPPQTEPTTRVCAVNWAADTYFDISTGPAGTTMERRQWPSGTFIDSNSFAKLNAPVPQGAMWGEGVAFAATMQTRHVWFNTEPNTAAFWTRPNAQDQWQFDTTFNGSPVSFKFFQGNCRDLWPAVI